MGTPCDECESLRFEIELLNVEWEEKLEAEKREKENLTNRVTELTSLVTQLEEDHEILKLKHIDELFVLNTKMEQMQHNLSDCRAQLGGTCLQKSVLEAELTNQKEKLKQTASDLDRSHQSYAALNMKCRRREDRIVALEGVVNGVDCSMFEVPYSELLGHTSKRKRINAAIKFIRKVAKNDECGDFFRDIMQAMKNEGNDDFQSRMTPEQAFYMFTKLGISKYHQEKLKRYMKLMLGFDVFPSRGATQSLESVINRGDMFDVKTVKIVDEKKGEMEVVVGQLRELENMVSSRLTDLSDSGKLTFDESTEDAIWFGIFGDKGGGTTKLVGVIGNCQNPNSPYHIIPLAVFEGEDNAHYLKSLAPEIVEKINNFKEVDYIDNGVKTTKRIVQYLGGDLMFICAMLGHMGASSSFNCPICYHPNDKSAKLETYQPNRHYPYRSQQSYVNDQQVGPKYHSVKEGSEWIFKIIDVHHIIPPSLHILMGLAQKYLFNRLLDIANQIDNTTMFNVGKLGQQRSTMQKIASLVSSKKHILANAENDMIMMQHIVTSMENYRLYSNKAPPKKHISCAAEYCLYDDKCMHNAKLPKPMIVQCTMCFQQLHDVCCGIWDTEDRNRLMDPDEELRCFNCLQADLPIVSRLAIDRRDMIINDVQQISDELVQLQSDAADIEKLLVHKSGDTRKQLEAIWSSLGADMSTWFQTFTGNQVYRLLSPDAISQYMSIFPDSEEIKSLTKVARKLGMLIHNKYLNQVILEGCLQKCCSTACLNDDELQSMEDDIKDLAEALKQSQPDESITLKLHFLFSHVHPFAKQHHTWGKTSEQGIEAYHAYFNSLLRRFSSTRNRETRLMRILKFATFFNRISDSNYF